MMKYVLLRKGVFPKGHNKNDRNSLFIFAHVDFLEKAPVLSLQQPMRNLAKFILLAWLHVSTVLNDYAQFCALNSGEKANLAIFLLTLLGSFYFQH